MLATSTGLEVLDLRHFSAPAVRPLLEEEVTRWQETLLWDYSRSVELLLDFINSRSLTGYVALRHGRVTGYAFGVCEAAKAIMGDLYAFGEASPKGNPICATLLQHLVETLQSVPGINRVESQLLLFPEEALHDSFLAQGFQAFPRYFMLRDLGEAGSAGKQRSLPPLSSAFRIEGWSPESFHAAAALIREAYVGHMDADINDQYRTVAGAQRFLHNIVHFPGCGTFDPGNSWLLRDATTGDLAGMALCSRVRQDAAHITQFCVRPDLRKLGLGASLLQHCLMQLAANGLRTVSLTVTQSNAGALRLYERKGFKVWWRFNAWVWEKARG